MNDWQYSPQWHVTHGCLPCICRGQCSGSPDLKYPDHNKQKIWPFVIFTLMKHCLHHIYNLFICNMRGGLCRKKNNKRRQPEGGSPPSQSPGMLLKCKVFLSRSDLSLKVLLAQRDRVTLVEQQRREEREGTESNNLGGAQSIVIVSTKVMS